MKKIFSFFLALAISAPAFADVVQLIKCSPDGIPGDDDPMLMGMGISPDGKYICGSLDGKGVFITDRMTGETRYQLILVDDDDSQLRHVSNTGLGVGLGEAGILYSFTKDEVFDLGVPSDARYVLPEDITGNGDFMVGTLVGLPSGGTVGAYSEDGEQWTKLPLPAEKDMKGLEKLLQYGTAAKYVSSDRKVILGYVGSFGLPIAWVMNDKGEYEVDLFMLDYMKMTTADLENPDKPLMSVSAMYCCMSTNGRYIVSLGFIPTSYPGETRSVPVVYDMVEKELKIYDDEEQCYEGFYGTLYPLAICDDGSFIGSLGMPNYQSEGAFIMKAGRSQAQLFRDVFPEFEKTLGEGDRMGFNVPTGMSADGRYILGFVFYSEDYYDASTPAYYQTYVIDTLGEFSSVGAVSSGLPVAETVYSVDGRKLGHMSKGLNIVRNADGSVSKIIRK